MLCPTHAQRDLFRPDLNLDALQANVEDIEARARAFAWGDRELEAELLALPIEELARVIVELEATREDAEERAAEERARLLGQVLEQDLETANRSPSQPKRFEPDRDAEPPTRPGAVSSAPRAAIGPFSGVPQAEISGLLDPKEVIHEPSAPRTVPRRDERCWPGARCRLPGCAECDTSCAAYQSRRLDEHRRAMEARAERHLEARGAANDPDLRDAPPRAYTGAPSEVIAADPVPRAVRVQADAIACTDERNKALGWVRSLDTSSGVARAWRIAFCCRPVIAIQAKAGKLKVGWQLNKCRDRACPACAASRSRELTAAAREHLEAREEELDGVARFLFATLTQRKRVEEQEGCSAAFERLMRAWVRTYNRTAFKRCFSGGLRGTEVPWLEPDALAENRKDAKPKAEKARNRVRFPGWHAHFHMALELRPGVSRWYAECVLRSLWLENTMREDDIDCRLPSVRTDFEIRARMNGLDMQPLDDANLGQVCKYVTKPFELPDDKAPRFFRAMAKRKMCAGFGTWRRFLHSGNPRGGPQWYTTTTFRKLRELARVDGMVEVWGKTRTEPSQCMRANNPSLFAAFLRGDKNWFARLSTGLRNGTVRLGTQAARHAGELAHAEATGAKYRPLSPLVLPRRRIWYDEDGERHEGQPAPWRDDAAWTKGRTQEVYIGEIPARSVVRRLKADPRPTWEQCHSVHCRDHGCGESFRCRECDELLGVCMLEAGAEQHDVCEDCWPEYARVNGYPVDPERTAWRDEVDGR